jgi:hypothetical protein
MFLLKSLTPPNHEVLLIDGNTQPMSDAGLVLYGIEIKITLVGIGAMTRMIAKWGGAPGNHSPRLELDLDGSQAPVGSKPETTELTVTQRVTKRGFLPSGVLGLNTFGFVQRCFHELHGLLG